MKVSGELQILAAVNLGNAWNGLDWRRVGQITRLVKNSPPDGKPSVHNVFLQVHQQILSCAS